MGDYKLPIENHALPPGNDKLLVICHFLVVVRRNSLKVLEVAGFDLVDGDTAIVPVMLYDEPLAIKFADELLKEGVYVIGFCFPVVPRGKARIRVQLSAAHTPVQIDKAVEAFIKIGKELKVI